MIVILLEVRYVLIMHLFNSQNFGTSSALAKVCALQSAILVTNLLLSLLVREFVEVVYLAKLQTTACFLFSPATSTTMITDRKLLCIYSINSAQIR